MELVDICRDGIVEDSGCKSVVATRGQLANLLLSLPSMYHNSSLNLRWYPPEERDDYAAPVWNVVSFGNKQSL